MKWMLGGSLAVNGVLGLALARRLRRRAMIARGRIAPPDTDFAAAGTHFAACEPGSIALVGDSHIEHGPWLEVLTDYRNRGMSGAKIADVSGWIDGVLAGDPGQLVLMIGSNDVFFCELRAQSVAAARDLFDHIALTARCPVTVVSIPPLPADKRAVNALNKTFAELCAQHGFQWLDIRPTLAAMDWTVDGLHLTAAAYRAVAPGLADALETAKNFPRQN